MDPNGTRHHLIEGRADWAACQEEDLRDGGTRLGWNERQQTLTLRPLLSLFPGTAGGEGLDPAVRRGAARDGFGNWFWIGADRRAIHWLPVHGRRPVVFWSPPPPAACPPPGTGARSPAGSEGGVTPGAAGFQPVAPEPAPVIELAGLAVTAHHHLVAGDVTRRGLLVFDLRASGAPTLLLFPPGPASPVEVFEPFDIAAGPRGSFLVLDRRYRRYFAFDRHFRLATEAVAAAPPVEVDEPGFRPGGAGGCAPPPAAAGFRIDAVDPIAIEALPDGSALVLDTPPDAAASTLLHYRGPARRSALPLQDDVEAVVEGTDAVVTHLQVRGHDMAWSAGVLHVVERGGTQVIAFAHDPDASPPALSALTAFLPLHRFGGRALVASPASGSSAGCRGEPGAGVWYDVAGRAPDDDRAVRWVRLQAIDRPRYERRAGLLTPVLDGKERDCAWHRVFLDACVPGETSVSVWTRAANDPDLVPTLPFSPEPPLYLRATGPELPYADAFPGQPPGGDPFAGWKGTWELLIQRARGRYLQARLVLTGNGRLSPELRALRISYPRVSYPRRFLPAVYLEDASSADFLERMLANPEGFFTEIEARIADVRVLLDARSAPPKALEWLAGWLGLVLDPLWARLGPHHARRSPAPVDGYDGAVEGHPGCAGGPRARGGLGGHLGAPHVPDRRRLLIRFARRLFERRGTPSGVRFALELLLHPCLERTLHALEEAAVRPDAPIHRRLDALGVRRPTPAMTAQEIEDVLWDLVLAPARPSPVRLVERFLTRGGRARQAGDPTAASATAGPSEAIEAHAHRFTVLIPAGLDPDEALMVGRVVDLEKPAHAAYDVRHYWDHFRVEDARLGLDTVLGEEPAFLATVLGRNRLADGYLHPPPPMDAGDRVVADRDRVGAFPAL